jgi:hypothetical protein
MKLLNREYMRKQNVGKVKRIRLYNGTAVECLSSPAVSVAHEEAFEISSEQWMGSAARESVLRDLYGLQARVRQYNAATGYDAQTIHQLASLITLDLSRQADDYTDYGSVLYTEKKDENAQEIASLMNYLPFVGKEEDIMGTGDTVPLMQHKLPETYNVNMKIRGFGDKTQFRELVFNPFYKTENLISSAARILADEKNKDVFGPVMGATYGADHIQTAETSGPTLDVNMYNTIKKALIKALGLICKPVGKPNGSLKCEVYLLINDLDKMNIEPVVNGNLSMAGGMQQYVGALPIDGLIPYSGGLNDGLSYGSETLSYPGVARGYAYAFVKVDVYSGYRIVKQNETMEMSPGDILGMSSEKRLWYRIRGLHHDFVLPATEGTGANLKAYGAVVKIELPTA